MTRKKVPIHVILYYPETEEGRRGLAEKTADAHAYMVNEYICRLNCPSGQKAKLAKAVIETVSQCRKI